MSEETPRQDPSVKIAAVFATMNRSATALACIRSLANQTRTPELVVVADNAKDGHTALELKTLTGLPFDLITLSLPENLGNAGGVDSAMEVAFAQGADGVWILDDDSWPRPNALDAMLVEKWDPQVVRHPLQIDPRTSLFTWPLQVDNGLGGWRLVDTIEDMPDGDSIRSRIIWTGALLPREVWRAVGPVNRELFIRGEDEEYPWRFEQAGYSQRAVKGAIMDHPGPENLMNWSFCGKSFYFERGLNDWKLYYKIRNMVWLKKRQSGLIKAFGMALTYAIAVWLIDGAHRLSLVREAIYDGFKGRLGKWLRHPS